MGNENKIQAATGLSKELISLINTEETGWEVAITRNLKCGRTSVEVSTVKMGAHAKNREEALQVLKDIDEATMKFIVAEGIFYGVDPKRAAATPSPIERKE